MVALGSGIQPEISNSLLNRGIRPESLPAAEDVKKVQRRLSSDEKKALQTPEKLEGA
jgi:DNA-damage-inducible protein D